MCFLATSAGITPSTNGDTGVVVGSQNGKLNWSATAATRSRSLTSPSAERILARGTPVSDSLAERVLECVLGEDFAVHEELADFARGSLHRFFSAVLQTDLE